MDEAEVLREYGRLMGRRRSEKKAASSAANLEQGRQRLQDEDVRAKLRAAQQARRERERAAATSATATPAGAVAEERADYGA
jgi:hypothetical protein